MNTATSCDHTWRSPAEKYDLEEMVEKLDFAVITAREAIDRADRLDVTLN